MKTSKYAWLVVGSVFLAACSGTSGAPTPTPAPALMTDQAPLQCNKADRHGVYLFTFSVVSGNCGAIPSSLVNVDDTSNTASCSQSNETWTDGDCKKSVDEHCPATTNGPAFTITSISTQETQDGSILNGTETLNAPGPYGCLGTYSLHGVRQ